VATRPQRRRAKAEALLLSGLEKAGNVGLACKQAGVSRSTYYRWTGEDGDFAVRCEEALRLGREEISDLAHGRLIQMVEQGVPKAVFYQLSRRHPDYRYPKGFEAASLPDPEAVTAAAQAVLARAVVSGDLGAAFTWLKAHSPEFSARLQEAQDHEVSSEAELEARLLAFDRERVTAPSA
jgi:hypothetical protein